jgi:hypothetical protein
MADFSLKAVFGMDATGVKTELRQLRRELGNFVEDYAKLGAGIAVAAFTALSKGAIDLAGKLADASANIGINVVSLQALEAQHVRNGVSGEMLVKTLEKTKIGVLDAASGNATARAAFDTLGLSWRRLMTMPLDKQYEAVAKAVATSKNESAAYSAVCEILGDKVGPRLMGSLKELGTVGLPGVTKAAREAGQVMERETIVALDRAGDAIDDFKKRATIAVGNIIVNFRTEEGLKLLGLQLLSAAGKFGGGILDALKEANDFLGAVFHGTLRALGVVFQNALISAAETAATALNKVLPDALEINVGNLDQFRATGTSIAGEITRAIAATEPSTFKRDIAAYWDKAIKDQQAVVNALNKVDLGADVKALVAAGDGVAISMKQAADEAARKLQSGAEAAAWAIKEAADAEEAAARAAAKQAEDAAKRAKDALDAVRGLVSRTGVGYDQQSKAALEGSENRLARQLQQIEEDQFGKNFGVGGGGKPQEWYMVQNELFNIRKELELRESASKYAARYGEDAARGQFGDSITSRALQDMTNTSVRQANTLDQINRRLGSLLDD